MLAMEASECTHSRHGSLHPNLQGMAAIDGQLADDSGISGGSEGGMQPSGFENRDQLQARSMLEWHRRVWPCKDARDTACLGSASGSSAPLPLTKVSTESLTF